MRLNLVWWNRCRDTGAQVLDHSHGTWIHLGICSMISHGSQNNRSSGTAFPPFLDQKKRNIEALTRIDPRFSQVVGSFDHRFAGQIRWWIWLVHEPKIARWGFPSLGFTMEKPFKMDDLGVTPRFRKPPNIVTLIDPPSNWFNINVYQCISLQYIIIYRTGWFEVALNLMLIWCYEIMFMYLLSSLVRQLVRQLASGYN